MTQAIICIVSNLASMATGVALFSAIGLGGVLLMEPRRRCNPYAVFPCTCGDDDDG